MGNTLCPGQDTRFWRPGDIFEVNCQSCGNSLEFFKDEATRRCRKCGARVTNPRFSLGCAQWCEHAKECLGYDPKEAEEADEAAESMVDRLIADMKSVFGKDQKRIEHALTVLEHSRALLRSEEASPKVVMAAAVLHDIGIKEAEKKHGSAAGAYQEMEGPPIAERIMKEAGLDNETIEHVSHIVGSHHRGNDIDTPEFRIVWDADFLVNLPEEHPDLSGAEIEKKIEKIMRTESGKARAREMFVQNRQTRAGG